MIDGTDVAAATPDKEPTDLKPVRAERSEVEPDPAPDLTGPPEPVAHPEPLSPPWARAEGVWPGLSAAGLPTRVPRTGDEETLRDAFYESWEATPTTPTPLTRPPFAPRYLDEPVRERPARLDGLGDYAQPFAGAPEPVEPPEPVQPPTPHEPPAPPTPPEPREPPEPAEPPTPPAPPGPSPFPAPTPVPTPPTPVPPTPFPVPPIPPGPPVPVPPSPFPPLPGPVPPPPTIIPAVRAPLTSPTPWSAAPTLPTVTSGTPVTSGTSVTGGAPVIIGTPVTSGTGAAPGTAVATVAERSTRSLTGHLHSQEMQERRERRRQLNAVLWVVGILVGFALFIVIAIIALAGDFISGVIETLSKWAG